MTPEHWDSYVYNLVDLSSGSARKRFRQSIKDAWGCCAYCGRSEDDKGEELALTLDHVRPRSRGGSTLRSNLIPACRRCNLSKGSERDWHGWYLKQQFYCGDRAERIRAWLQPKLKELRDSASAVIAGVITEEPGHNEHTELLGSGLGTGLGAGLGGSGGLAA
jgi:hypothetical protein